MREVAEVQVAAGILLLLFKRSVEALLGFHHGKQFAYVIALRLCKLVLCLRQIHAGADAFVVFDQGGGAYALCQFQTALCILHLLHGRNVVVSRCLVLQFDTLGHIHQLVAFALLFQFGFLDGCQIAKVVPYRYVQRNTPK